MGDQSYAGRLLGDRSLFSRVFGTFFSETSNTSGLLAFVLVSTVVFLVIAQRPVPDRLIDIVLVIIGFYFGGATRAKEARPKDSPVA